MTDVPSSPPRDATDPRSPVQEGDILAGKYRIERILGAGGMGVVVQATHTSLHDRVALKFLLPDMAANKVLVERFLREAQAAVRIKSPHVARVLDVGTLETGSPYMVMEFLEGRDIAAVLLKEKPLPIETAAAWAIEACEALASAHAAGVVHRDIKPGNLFITTSPDHRPQLKMLDFGISKMTEADAPGSMTRTHATMGSPLYMSPEQMRSSKHVDSRTDIWSLGVVLYEMLVGKVPFVADTLPELCAIVLDKESPPEPPRAIRPEIPEELEATVLRCLAKNRDERFTDMAEVAAALAPFAGENGVAAAQRCQRILEAAGLRRAGTSIVVPVGPESTGPRSRVAESVAVVGKEGPMSAAPSSKPAVTAVTGVDTATAFGGTDAGTKKPNRVALGALMGAGVALLLAVGGYRVLGGGGPVAGAQAGSQQGAMSAAIPVSAAPVNMPVVASAASVNMPSASSSAPALLPSASAPALPAAEPRPLPSAASKPGLRPGTPTRKPSSVFDDRQ